MKESIKRLRKAKREYDSARQARYNELSGWDPYGDNAISSHKSVVARMALEEDALDYPDGGFKISIHAYVKDDKLYVIDWEKHEAVFKFDLS